MRLVILLLALLPAACGYHVDGTGFNLPAGTERITIELFANQTSEPYLDAVMTNAMINRMIRLHNVQVIEDSQQADAVLGGEVLRYDVRGIAYDAQNSIQAYRVTMRVSAHLQRVSDGKILWRGEVIRYDDFVSTGSDTTIQQGLEEQARDRTAQLLAEDISWQMATDFGDEK